MSTDSHPRSDERLRRSSVSALDAILGRHLKVRGEGFVRVIDYMGDDAAIVQAARVSYGAGTKHVSEDRGLIRYLVRHWHTTPFEMCEIKLHIRAPMDVWRQWIRHRTASVNEYSTRYSLAIDAAQRTAPNEWRSQSALNRQGSVGILDTQTGAALSAEEQKLQASARAVYEKRIEAGVAREQARKDLPLSTYTEAYWKINLHNLLHFLNLRMGAHAQLEIREFASLIGEKVVAQWVPLVWEAFVDYRLGATQLSRIETQIISAITRGQIDEALSSALASGFLERMDNGRLGKNRERIELENKLQKLGMTIPWTEN